MGKLTDLISERRRRQEDPDRVVAIFRIIIDPVTKKEATDVPRQASVIGGPRLQQEPDESHEAFKARVMTVANQLKNEKKDDQLILLRAGETTLISVLGFR